MEHSVQHLRVFRFPCCGTILCWINRRIPKYCPECGQPVFVRLKTEGEHTLMSDPHAEVSHH
jgi:hypothetical protein